MPLSVQSITQALVTYLDARAPPTSKTSTSHSPSPWFHNDLLNLKNHFYPGLRVVALRCVADQRQAFIFILLDLLAAYDTIDHIFLQRLHSFIGLSSTNIEWFRSYLSD